MSSDLTPRVNFGVLDAPAHWQAVDLISDLHLQAGEPATFEAWRDWMDRTDADAVLILGDLFEVWVGDDVLAHDPFAQACAEVLHRAAQRCQVGFMPGNRDFLVGPGFLQSCSVEPLTDPTVLHWRGRRIVLSHGDALCLDDEAYQRFRAVARTPKWQSDFLAKPLAERQAMAQAMRTQSEAHNQSMHSFADADVAMTLGWMQQADSTHLIHGHTHRPGSESLAPGFKRHVLSDWDLDHADRAEVLRLTRDGFERRPPASAANPS